MPAESKDAAPEPQPEWLTEIAALEGGALALDAFWAGRPDLHEPETISRLTREVTRLARREPPVAEKLSRVASRFAELLGDAHGRALAAKAEGHLRFLVGDYEGALRLYRSCQEQFRAAGAEIEAAVNLGSSMWMLALLGRYDEAWGDSRRARAVLDSHSDPVLLARVVTNEGNIFLRQDRHREALERYRSALELFREGGEIQDIAVTLHNIAVSSIAISDFTGALESYRELKLHCGDHGLSLLAAQADYNIAYLYFFRGEYRRAIRIYQDTRRQCEALGDEYHRALCDLDQSEIYLELNLRDDARRLAQRAYEAFDPRGNGYEAAKALTFLAIAATQQGDRTEALQGFSRARERFEAEGNRAWAAMTDFYRAIVHHDLLNAVQARERCSAAREFFASVSWASRVALCDLLLAQIDLRQGDPRAALERSRVALQALDEVELPSLTFKALVALGQSQEALGHRDAALEAYRKAHALLEDLRTHLGSEESKIAFLADKLGVYEVLVELTLESSPTPEGRELAFGYIEQAKSRSLADLVLSSGSELRAAPSDNPELVERMRGLRAELTQHHHELDQLYGLRLSADPASALAQNPVPAGAGTPAETRDPALASRIEEVKRESRACEAALLETLRELRLRDSKFASVHTAETVELEAIRASIPNDALILEYFESRGALFVCVLGAGVFEILPLAATSEVAATLDLFTGQMAKYQLGEAYLKQMGQLLSRSVLTCLGELYRILVEPLEKLLDCDHLVVIPHGILHKVPFHALLAGSVHLCERFDVSYSPSASIFAALQSGPPSVHQESLVLGVPDARAPEILDEVATVAQLLPRSTLLVGEEATAERLRELAPTRRVLHIATHGFFRTDSPMFSAIQLAGSRLTLLDLYDLELGAELVVLSGCSTGLHKVETGDELIGLSRGFLFAGAQSLVTSLWDVHDRSSAAFMKAFYGQLRIRDNRARALSLAVEELRASYPEPYHWAPFVLIGRYLGHGGAS